MIFVFRELLRHIKLSDDEVGEIAELCGSSGTMIVLGGSAVTERLWNRFVRPRDVRDGILVVGGLVSPRQDGVTEICEEDGFARGPGAAEAEHLLGQMLVEGVLPAVICPIAHRMDEFVTRCGERHRPGGLMQAFSLGLGYGRMLGLEIS
jgi:hypothetical protein